MADNDVIKEPMPSFDLGIEDSVVYGNLTMANDFLSGNEVTSSPEDIEKNEPPKVAPVKKTVETKAPVKKEEEPPKVTGEELVNEFLTDPKEEEEDITPEDKTPKGEEPADNANSTFEDLSESLYEAGIFTVEDGEDPIKAKDADEFLELFQKEKVKGVSTVLENYLSKHGEDRKELFDAIFVKGVDPNKYLPVHNEATNFEKLDIENESNQEKVIRTFYTRAGWTKEKVDEKIEKLKNYADLEDEAKNMHPLLVKQDKEKLAAMEDEAEAIQLEKAEQDREYKAAITKVLQEKVKTKDFDGLPLDEKTASKAFDFLYSKKWKLPSGELLTDFDKAVLESKNPDNIANRVKMALLYMNNFDLTKVQKKAVAKESNQLFNKLVRKDSKTTKTPENTNAGW